MNLMTYKVKIRTVTGKAEFVYLESSEILEASVLKTEARVSWENKLKTMESSDGRDFAEVEEFEIIPAPLEIVLNGIDVVTNYVTHQIGKAGMRTFSKDHEGASQEEIALNVRHCIEDIIVRAIDAERARVLNTLSASLGFGMYVVPTTTISNRHVYSETPIKAVVIPSDAPEAGSNG